MHWLKTDILIVFVCFSLLIGSFDAFSQKKDEPYPNIILFYADDLGWMDVGYQGNTFYETPHMDRLAREGMVFTNGYANAPFCSPSRASLMTGLYTPKHQIYIPGSSQRGPEKARKLVPPENKEELDPDFTTIAEYLKTKNYRTAHIGKWDLGDGPSGPLNQGFDINVGGNNTGKIRSFFSPYRNKDIIDGPEGEYLTDRLTQEALNFIKSQQQPFFLYLSHYAPHTPIRAPNSLVRKYKGKLSSPQKYNPTYAAMVESLDHSLGQILELLENSGKAENTLLLFYSDNGGYSLATSNLPLRGSKGNLYEGGISVPMVAWWPGKIKSGSQSDVPVIGSDLFPTFMEMTGEANADLDGKSILPLMLGKKHDLEDRAIFWYEPVYLDSYDSTRYERDGAMDRIDLTSYNRLKQNHEVESLPGDTYPAWRLVPAAAVRKGDYKLIRYLEYDSLELYHLPSDPYETNNLSAKNKKKAKELNLILENWAKTSGANLELMKNAAYDPKAIDNYSEK